LLGDAVSVSFEVLDFKTSSNYIADFHCTQFLAAVTHSLITYPAGMKV